MNVLFVGLGSIGQRHLRNLMEENIPDLHVFAYRVRGASFVLDDTLHIREGEILEQRYPITMCHTLEEAWHHKMDAVFICNPTSRHKEILDAAATQDCAVFVEKPVAESMDGMDALLRQFESKKQITCVGYQNRFHPCIEQAKTILDRNGIGDVVSVQAEIGEDVRTWHKYENYKTMYACRKDLGGGVVLSQIHELDYIPYMVGATPLSVYAAGGTLGNLGIDVEDVADILLTARIAGREIPVHIHEDYLQNPPARTCKIVGTNGRLEFDLLHAHIVQYDANGEKLLNQTYTFSRNDMFRKELRLFIDAIRTKTDSYIPLREGLKSLRLAEAVKLSMNNKNIVKL